MIFNNLKFLIIYCILIGTSYGEDKTTSTETWKAILGDVCQLPNFPKPTADPKRYLECVKQKVSLDRSDLGTWQLRECLDGYEFVASSRSCKSISNIRRSQSLCDTPNASKYDYCNSNSRFFTVSETIQAPRQCTCPNGANNCVCPQPEILSPKRATKRMKRQSDSSSNSVKITINLPSCPCNTEAQPSCACIDKGLNKVQVFKDSCCKEGTQLIYSTQRPQQACLCEDYSMYTTTTQIPYVYSVTTQVPYIYPTSTTVTPSVIQNDNIVRVNNKSCQITTTGELYCPEESQYTYTEPQSCPLVVSGLGNARYQGICSWMTDPLAVDPESRTHFLQCQPAPKNLYCGRWQRMPCAPATVFDVNIQVCVWDTSIQGTGQGIGGGIEVGPIPLPQQTTSTFIPQYSTSPFYTTTTYPYTSIYTTTQAYQQSNQQCSCNGGIPIGTCNQNYQCPGQSLCQIGINIETKQTCKVCCYYKKK